MKYHSEVLLYLQKVKKFFELNIKAKEHYFILYSDDVFYEKVAKIAQENYDKNGEPTLNIAQFESLREPEKIDEKYNISIDFIDNIFINFNGYEKICLN